MSLSALVNAAIACDGWNQRRAAMSITAVSDRATPTDRVTVGKPRSRKDRSFSYLCTFAALGLVVSILSVALAGLAIAE
jgi:hypothetical protein